MNPELSANPCLCFAIVETTVRLPHSLSLYIGAESLNSSPSFLTITFICFSSPCLTLNRWTIYNKIVHIFIKSLFMLIVTKHSKFFFQYNLHLLVFAQIMRWLLAQIILKNGTKNINFIIVIVLGTSFFILNADNRTIEVQRRQLSHWISIEQGENKNLKQEKFLHIIYEWLKEWNLKKEEGTSRWS